MLLLAGALYLAGCGGGGGGPAPTPTATPTATATPVSGNIILVRLRDAGGALVDGVVTLTAGASTFRLGTTGGQASFAGFVAGNYAVSASVNGQVQSQNFSAGNGTTTVDISFPNGLTPTPAGTIPPPPF